MHLKFLLTVFAGTLVLAMFVFREDVPSDGDDLTRAFLAACEGSAFARAEAPDTVGAVTLCSCVLAWHLKEGVGNPAALPTALYVGTSVAPGVPERSAATDVQARRSCAVERRRR